MQRPSVPEGSEEMVRKMNEKIDVKWSYIKDMREELNNQSELFKNRLACLEMKLDTVLTLSIW